MIKSRLGAAGDIEMILDAAEQMNAEIDWGLTWRTMNLDMSDGPLKVYREVPDTK